MKSYEETIISIHKKAAELNRKQEEEKKKARIIFSAIIPAVLVACIMISIGITSHISKQGNRIEPGTDFITENSGQIESGDAPTENSGQIETDNASDWPRVIDVEPSIYPAAWRKMNAFLIRWGEPGDDRYSDSIGIWNGNEMTPSVIDFTSVSVTILKCFTSTVQEKYDENERYGLGEAIKSFSHLMVPDALLDEIRPGDTSLVFVKLLYSTTLTNSEGKALTATNKQGNQVNVFEYTFTTYFTIASDSEAELIFAAYPVVDNELVIPDSAYKLKDNGDYYSYQTSLLQHANNILEREGINGIQAFRSGMSIEAIEKFFDYFCNSNYS